MEESSTTIPAAEEAPSQPLPIVFRGKKRKTYRQRATDDDDDDDEPLTSIPMTDTAPSNGPTSPSTSNPASSAIDNAAASSVPDATQNQPSLSISEALRLRNARRSNKFRGGVAFRATNDATAESDGKETGSGAGADGLDDLSLMIREEEQKAIVEQKNTLSAAVAANKRFAPQTGLSGELVNRHMEKYIEAELAKKRNALAGQDANNSSAPSGNTNTYNYSYNNTAKPTGGVTDIHNGEKHTALTGKLFEVDLGDEVRNHNELMTDRARRKMAGEVVEDDDIAGQQAGGRPKKVRLGPDGKPWRSRNRRDSDAVQRDKLVEELMRENRLDVYENPATSQIHNSEAHNDTTQAADKNNDDDGSAADDRIAEEFRREFMDAMAERHRRKRPVGPPNVSSSSSAAKRPGAKNDDEVLKGPKLGGSRNTRAAMRDLLLAKEKEKEGSKGRGGFRR
ncbi:hypothetical protein F5Y16DRAFT_235022 [Xylariaceae sp. FL0255]|nr:hypothetical protein F5Y16DRAFT_235022 [Xylariaceae sp. FL0255]